MSAEMVVSVPQSLDDILEVALRSNSTGVSLEYDSSGDLEVTYFSGNSGLGVAVSEATVKQRFISELIDRAGLETKVKGTIRVARDGSVQVVRVSQRDHFGESAFDLRFGA
jgi:hypothetical protein